MSVKKFDFEEMDKKIQDLKKLIKKYEDCFDDCNRAMDSINGYWQGEDSDIFYNAWKNFKKQHDDEIIYKFNSLYKFLESFYDDYCEFQDDAYTKGADLIGYCIDTDKIYSQYSSGRF